LGSAAGIQGIEGSSQKAKDRSENSPLPKEPLVIATSGFFAFITAVSQHRICAGEFL
jgi:hypothetical protein